MLDEAKRTKLEAEYVPGEELQQLSEKMLSQPAKVVTRVKTLLQRK
jgi:hypothetical protein